MYPKISLIIPAFNEESNLPSVYQRIKTLFSSLPYAYEAIIIDNASTDRTQQISTAICKDLNWKYIRFSRNFTSEISITAGLHYATGDAVMVVFSDLQDPPELIPKFISKWEEGYDVVCGLLTSRSDDVLWKRPAASLMYYVLNKTTGIPKNATDFRLLSRKAVDAINQFPERNRYFRGISHYAGFKTAYIPYKRSSRISGKSNSNLLYLIDFVIRAITNFSTLPLRLFSILGVLTILSTFFFTAFSIYQYFRGITIPGLTTIIILLLFNIGLMSLGIGVLGEYLGRTYIESKQRPLWIVDNTININT